MSGMNIAAVLQRAQAAICQSESITRQIVAGCSGPAADDVSVEITSSHTRVAAECGHDLAESASAHDLSGRLSSLKSQHCSTLQQLYSLRLQQLTLRKQQVSALQSILAAQLQLSQGATGNVVRICMG